MWTVNYFGQGKILKVYKNNKKPIQNRKFTHLDFSLNHNNFILLTVYFEITNQKKIFSCSNTNIKTKIS